MGAGGFCALGVPAALSLFRHYDSTDEWRTYMIAIVFVSVFLFFLFSTISKLGFQTLMQVSQHTRMHARTHARMRGFLFWCMLFVLRRSHT